MNNIIYILITYNFISTFSEKTVQVDDPSYIKLKFKPDEIKNVSRSNLRMPTADERYLVSARGSPVAQCHQVTLIQVKSVDDEEWESLDIDIHITVTQVLTLFHIL